jgi:hypothetical protein
MFIDRKFRINILVGILPACMFMGVPAAAQKKIKAAEPPLPISAVRGGHLSYAPDEQGNRAPDFSYSGYMSGAQPLPDVPVKVVVPVRDGDATVPIQKALDYVGGLPADARGIRGAVLLEKGTYEIAGSLRIDHSGVVLRGSGMETGGTVLVASGTDRRTLIRIVGKNDKVTGNPVGIADAYVPVNATQIRLKGNNPFKVGDKIVVHRPSTQAWINALGMDHFGGGITALAWKPGQRDIDWDREVAGVDGSSITLDVPLTTALDTTYGGGAIAGYQWPGRIAQTGVENLVCRSGYDARNPKDEAHSWMAITMENVRDAWVRQVVFEHFAGSAVAVLETAGRVTVEDCKSLAPVSEIGGQRRNTFITLGQQTLFHGVYAEYGYHDFSTGFCAPGPNAFVDCFSFRPYSFSGSVDSWASGVLFDVVKIDGQALGYFNRGQDGQGAGWNAANSVLWNCSASLIDCYRPPTAENWSFGSWAQFGGDGFWASPNSTIEPRSLYYAQLADRLGDSVRGWAHLLPIMGDASSSPTPAQAAALIAASTKPALTLDKWIDQAPSRHPIPVSAAGAPTIDKIGYTLPVPPKKAAPMVLAGGWLVRGGSVLTGRRYYEPWWEGSVRPYGVAEAKPAITRFVPGRTGTGFTDDLAELTDVMERRHIVALDHNYGLWYDRRRDDHERIRRMDGDVWPPFYELPFARSGKDSAWDGLSKYDLTTYNRWYWSRLKQFADLADQKGLVLIHQNYFQHNIIEAGAHYADFPWRPANNINNTGFPEPPPFAGDKRIFMADQFYDTAQPVREALHRAFIRQCLENFRDNTGVIQLTAFEYTGPLHFVQFWVDNIRTWEAETGKKECIGLSATKDVQDSILSDPFRSPTVNVIDIRYWYYQEGGKVYAPLGGENMAPRQHERVLKPRRPDFDAVYHSVREYRDKYPDKAVMYSAEGCDQFGWAVFMAGGSLANIPSVANPAFLSGAARMLPVDLSGNPRGQCALGNPEVGYIIYARSGGSVQLDLSRAKGSFRLHRIDPEGGTMGKDGEKISGGKTVEIPGSAGAKGTAVWWLEKA